MMTCVSFVLNIQIKVLRGRALARVCVFAVGEQPDTGSILGSTTFPHRGFPVIRFQCSLVVSGDLSKDVSSYMCIVVGLIVYKYGVGVCMYTNRCYNCILKRGVKKNQSVAGKKVF